MHSKHQRTTNTQRTPNDEQGLPHIRTLPFNLSKSDFKIRKELRVFWIQSTSTQETLIVRYLLSSSDSSITSFLMRCWILPTAGTVPTINIEAKKKRSKLPPHTEIGIVCIRNKSSSNYFCLRVTANYTKVSQAANKRRNVQCNGCDTFCTSLETFQELGIFD